MIPIANQLKEVDVISIPSKDYRMEIVGNRVAGNCEDLEELRQTIFCILSTERYRYPVYSWNYGIELEDLYGKPMDYVMSELQRRITEALTQDDRIEAVDNFEFETVGKRILAVFIVHTIFGDTTEEMRWSNV